MMSAKTGSTEERMNQVCARLGLPFKAVWTPDPSVKDHGKIDLKNQVILIFDLNEKDAWITLIHEILELKIRPLLSFYRNLVNTLIEFIQQVGYKKKEEFLSSLPSDISRIMFEVENARNGKGD